MAQVWKVEIVRGLIQKWAACRIEDGVAREGLTVNLAALEDYILSQNPATLEEAERLLDMIGLVEAEASSDLGLLCRLNGVGRNDLGRNNSRVEVSFAPCAFGPLLGHA